MPGIKRRKPEAGDIVVFQVLNGQYGAARVVREASKQEVNDYGAQVVVVVLTPYLAKSPPEISDPVLTESLMITHGFWQGEADSYDFVTVRLPKEFYILGQVEVSKKEAKIKADGMSTWLSLPESRYFQWLWDTDRKRYDAEMDEDEEDEEFMNDQEQHRETLNQMNLKRLKTYPFLKSLDGVLPKRQVAAYRKILEKAAADMVKLGAKASEADKRAVIQACVEAFNKRKDIDTLEREAIYPEIEIIQHGGGLGHIEGLIDEWRDW